MNKLLRDKDILLSQQLFTKKKYYISNVIAFVIILLYLLIFILAIYYWNSLNWYFKGALVFILFLLTPDIRDMKHITRSYDSYYKEWKDHNDDKSNCNI